VDGGKGKKNGKKSYSLKSSQEREAFCRIVIETAGHFYLFPFAILGLKIGRENNRILIYEYHYILFISRQGRAFKKLARNLI
jgi:hypothetical protein